MQVKILTIGLFCMVCSSTLYADYNVNDLQKLFTDKRQRAQLDATRSGKTASRSQRTNKINVNGYVTRSDGKSVAWVNNKNTIDNSRIGDVKVHSGSIGKNKKVTISVDGKVTRLRPGESWINDSGDSDTTK